MQPNDDKHTDTGSVELSKKELLRLLAHPRRRYILHRLNQTDHPFELQTLARTTAEWEAGMSPETVSAEFIERVRMSLYHKHIPKLAAAGILVFDERSEMVTLDTSSYHFEVVAEAVADGDPDNISE
ncbi:DUF7344 domain-containing protein [Haladaptatus litoreus]|uniref:DUF7344 domain-containing protein n=1 Tax=Haladaptatus litoreus TaxID=553468 RepID=UPI00097076C5|nr:hypothetical protein [Haladaptatus litoreus]